MKLVASSARLVAIAALLAAIAGCSGGSTSASTTESSVPPPGATAGSSAPATTPTSPATPPGSQPPSAVQGATADDVPVLGDLSAPDFTPSTRTEELAGAISSEAQAPTLQQAIDVFDVTMADMSGATPSTLPDGTGLSATYALHLIEAHRLELSPEQLAIVDSFDGAVVASLDNPATSPADTTPSTSLPSASAAPSSATDATDATVAASNFRLRVRPADGSPTPTTPAPSSTTAGVTAPVTAPVTARFARLLTQTQADWKAYRNDLISPVSHVDLKISPTQPKSIGPTTDMATLGGTRERSCTITVYPNIWRAAATDDVVKFAFAHELFHCIQNTWNPNFDDAEYHAAWLIEGSATFAAFDLYRATYVQTKRYAFDGWFASTSTPLAQSGYDAWPLYEAFRDRFEVVPYSAIEQMVKAYPATSPAVVLKAGGFDNQAFATMWTSTSLRADIDDADFKLIWPGYDPDYGSHDTAVLLAQRGVGKFNVRGKGNYVHQQYHVPFAANVGLVGVIPSDGPMLTYADNTTVSVGEGQQRWFCTDGHGCPCPEGSTSKVPTSLVTGPMLFTFATQADASSAAVTALAWDPARDCTTPEPRGTATGRASGDPHMTTLDGLNYDFMALGEWITTKDPHGDLTVEERHQPLLFGAGVSAVAIGTQGHRVTFTGSSFDGGTVVARLDGNVTTASKFAVGDVQVVGDGQDNWTATWPDGSVVDADWRDGFFIDVTLSADRAARTVGLLGATHPSFVDDLTDAAGKRALPGDGSGRFERAWLVTDATTLFDYDSGQSTATFRQGVLPPPTSPTQATIDTCTNGLGIGATAFEVQSCTYDATAGGDATPFVGAYHRITAARIATHVADPSSVTTAGDATADSVPNNGSTPVAVDAGKPALTLKGPISLGGTFGSDVKDSLDGSLDLPAGTVLLARAACPKDPGFDLTLQLTSRADGSSSSVGLCGNVWQLSTYDAGPSEAHEGEGYLLVRQAGTFDVHVTTGSQTAEYTSVQLYADPTPITVKVESLPVGTQKTIALSGVGDVAVVYLQGGDYTITGADQVCSLEYYIDGADGTGIDDLGGDCKHHDKVGLGDSTGQIPLVLIDRTGVAAQVTVAHSA